MKKKLEIIFEDDDLVFVNKPANFLSLPDRYAQHIPNLYHQLENQFGKIFVIHRLDKETSGGILFAKNEAAHKHLNQQFEFRSVQKIYYAIVDGVLYKSEGIIDKPIAPSQTRQGKMVIHSRGKESITHYKLREQFQHFAFIELDIKTGRTHQIRIHLEALGYPLIVDSIYGKRDAFYLSEIKHKKYRLSKGQEERPLLTRTALHAGRLQFEHPTTKEQMTLEVPLHKDLKAVVNQLRKWN